MATIAEIERLAIELPEDQRTILVEHLLGSLPHFFDQDEAEEIAEAERRSAEMDADPSIGLSLEEFDRRFKALKF